MFVILITYKKPLAVIDEYLEAHREFLAQCYKNNQFIVSGPAVPRVGGIIISQLSDRKQVEELIKKDPFAANDLASYAIHEFMPTKYHENFTTFVNQYHDVLEK